MGKLLDFAPLPARPVASPDGLSEGDARMSPREFVAKALEFIPTDFGRLALLGSLQDKESVAYRGAFAALAFDDTAVNEALLELHEETFRAWLARDVPSQTEDVVQYCRSVGKSARQLAADWILRNDDSAVLVPSSVPPKARGRFSQGLAMVLASAYACLI